MTRAISSPMTETVIVVWFLFSLSALYRQAARDADAIDADKRAAITRVLGTDAWEKELYAPRQPGLFSGDEASVWRTADVAHIEDYVRARLRTIFPALLKPMPLPVFTRPQKFSLFFAISNADGAATGLATRIANHVLKTGISSQIYGR
jgi:three-Cys-motif partner protein